MKPSQWGQFSPSFLAGLCPDQSRKATRLNVSRCFGDVLARALSLLRTTTLTLWGSVAGFAA
jgi:hypothetical protein